MDPYCCKCSYCRAMNSNSYPRFQISILVEPVMVHLPHEAANSECVFLTKPFDFWSCSFSWPISRYLGGQGQLDTTCHWRQCRPLTPPGATSFSSSLPQTKFFNHMGSHGDSTNPPNRCPLSPMGDLRPVQSPRDKRLMKFVKPPFLGSKKYPISQHFPWPNSWCHQDSVTIYQVPESGGVYSLLINESEKDVHGPNIRNPSLVFKKHGRFSQMGTPQLIVYPLEI